MTMTGDWWEWQERQFQDWLLDQKIVGAMRRSPNDGDDDLDVGLMDELNAELSEIEVEQWNLF